MIQKRFYPWLALIPVVAIGVVWLGSTSGERSAAECTRLAAHPDEKLPTGGVPLNSIQIPAARAACAESVTKLGRPELHYRLARTYLAGQPNDEEKALALRHGRIAHDAKVPLAAVLLANMHSAGLGTPFDLDRAIALLGTAIQQRLPSALMLGGMIELDQSDKPGHVERGMALLELAATNGTPGAFLTMGDRYARLNDPRRAVSAYQQAEAAGLVAGSYGLGLTYGQKGSPASDPVKAFASFRKAANAGHAASHGQASLALYNGDGVSKNLPDALAWAVKGSGLGDSVSQYVAGYMLFNAEGAPKDALAAERHLLLAVANNHVAAKKLYEESVRPFAAALKAMPSGSAGGCTERRTSRYDENVVEFHNRCANPLNVLVCKRFVVTEIASLFDSARERESCGVRTVAGNAPIDDLYGAGSDSSLLRVMISQMRIQLWPCYYPLTPRRSGDTASCAQ